MLSYASSMFDLIVVIAIYVMFNIPELIMEIVPNYSTIQKPNCRQFPELSMTALADALKQDKFACVHFKMVCKGHGLVYCSENRLDD